MTVSTALEEDRHCTVINLEEETTNNAASFLKLMKQSDNCSPQIRTISMPGKIGMPISNSLRLRGTFTPALHSAACGPHIPSTLSLQPCLTTSMLLNTRPPDASSPWSSNVAESLNPAKFGGGVGLGWWGTTESSFICYPDIPAQHFAPPPRLPSIIVQWRKTMPDVLLVQILLRCASFLVNKWQIIGWSWWEHARGVGWEGG